MCVDTVAFIYLIEEHLDYLPVVEKVFALTGKGGCGLVTSAITLLEVLVVPYRTGDSALAERYEAVLTRSRGLSMVAVDTDQLKAAAQLRAIYGVRTPDALQLTAGLSRRCTAFVTNDRDLPEVGRMRVLQLSDW